MTFSLVAGEKRTTEAVRGASWRALARFHGMRDAAPLSPTEAAAWHGLLRAHAALVRDVDTELRAAHGIPLSWYRALAEVAAAPSGRLRMGELAGRVMLTRAGLSGLVDRLERARLIERQSCDGDARGSYAVLTPEGSRLLERAGQTHREAIRRRYTSRLDERELGLLGGLGDRLGVGRLSS